MDSKDNTTKDISVDDTKKQKRKRVNKVPNKVNDHQADKVESKKDKLSDTYLLAFKAITEFINDLSEQYGKEYKPIRLYNRLISQTQISHIKVIHKHIESFKLFCVGNREVLYSKEFEKLDPKKIEYSPKVYIDVHDILKKTDEESKTCIFKHLLCISALIDPAGRAKDVLKKAMEDNKTGSEESEFLSKILSSVEKNVGETDNPMAAVSSIMSSGLLTDLMGGMQSGLSTGKLDLSKLLGAVQGMVSSITAQSGDDPEVANAMTLLNNVTGMVNNVDANGQPDMSNMGNLMQSMLGGLTGQTKPPVTEVTEDN